MSSTKRWGQKIVNMYAQVLFYSVLSLVMYLVFKSVDINISLIKQTVFPFSTNVLWFYTCAAAVYLLQPFINITLSRIDKKQYTVLVIILLIGFTAIPTLIYNVNPYFSNIGWLLTLYVIGTGIKRFDITMERKKAFLLFLGMWLLMWILDIILEEHTDMEVNYFSYMFRVPMLVAPMVLFLGFVQIEMPYNRVINSVSKNVLGVYLLQDCLFFRNYFWSFSKASAYHCSWLFLVHMILCSAFLFVLGIAVEYFRGYVTGKQYTEVHCIMPSPEG